MLRLLFALIGYVSTATVIAAAIGLVMFWQSGGFSDAKMFQAVALLHDVDLNQVAADEEDKAEGVPAEEMSLAQRQHTQQVLDRNFEVKQLALQRGRQEFIHQLKELDEKAERIDRQAQEIQDKLVEQQELSTKESVARVVANLQIAPPETAKLDLLRMMEEQRQEDVVKLWIAMPKNTRKNILGTIETDEERDHLHELHRLLLAGYPERPELDNAIEQLDSTAEDDL